MKRYGNLYPKIWDLENIKLATDASFTLSHKIDGVTYRIFETDTFTVATDSDGILITGFTINNDFKLEITTGAEGGNKDIIYNIIYQIME